MLAAHRDWQRIGLLDKPGAWVRRVTLNLAASFYRRHLAELRALVRLGPLRGSPPASLEAEAAEFWREVRKLPRRQAEAVTLHYLEGLGVSEQRYGISYITFGNNDLEAIQPVVEQLANS